MDYEKHACAYPGCAENAFILDEDEGNWLCCTHAVPGIVQDVGFHLACECLQSLPREERGSIIREISEMYGVSELIVNEVVDGIVNKELRRFCEGTS